jgi:hypothetical protein
MTHFDFVRGIFDGVFGTTLTIARAKSDRLLAEVYKLASNAANRRLCDI